MSPNHVTGEKMKDIVTTELQYIHKDILFDQ